MFAHPIFFPDKEHLNAEFTEVKLSLNDLKDNMPYYGLYSSDSDDAMDNIEDDPKIALILLGDFKEYHKSEIGRNYNFAKFNNGTVGIDYNENENADETFTLYKKKMPQEAGRRTRRRKSRRTKRSRRRTTRKARKSRRRR